MDAAVVVTVVVAAAYVCRSRSVGESSVSDGGVTALAGLRERGDGLFIRAPAAFVDFPLGIGGMTVGTGPVAEDGGWKALTNDGEG